MKKILILIITFVLLCVHAPAQAATLVQDTQSAAIIAYQRIGDDTNPDSSLQTEQFLAHINAITSEGYNVIALPDLIKSIQNKNPIPPRTLAITFDGAYASTLKNAIPILLERKMPFTLFYASGPLDSNEPGMMTWDELKQLSQNTTVTLGVMPMHYARLSDAPESEIRRALNKARLRHREEFSQEAQFFSYPFGEYSSLYKKLLEQTGFQAALGMNSGATSPASDMFALPRFIMTDRFGDIERFDNAVRALPFPVTEIEPPDTLFDDTLPIGFSVPPELIPSLKNLSCFTSGQPTGPEIKILGPRVELRLQKQPDTDRLRINCTLPAGKDAEDDTQLWRWLGILLAPKSDMNSTETGASVKIDGDDTDSTDDNDQVINNPEPGALP
jgi:peptidoglycan/xylan/chitin deacetylase (PgdA/CDA1 family)